MSSQTSKSYIIKGGSEGRERLRLLTRVMAPTTNALLDRVGICLGARCADVGCGGGDVTLELARRVGENGWVTGIDFDSTVIAIARREAAAKAVTNVAFDVVDVNDRFPQVTFDMVFARFLLSHLTHPARVIDNMISSLRPGGLIVVEDVDFNGHFCYPPCEAFNRYTELYKADAKKRGVDANIGPRLPALLREGGAEAVQVSAAMPCGLDGEVKLMAQITMERISDSVIEAGLATAAEINGIVSELTRYAADPVTVMSIPRIIQSWGRRP